MSWNSRQFRTRLKVAVEQLDQETVQALCHALMEAIRAERGVSDNDVRRTLGELRRKRYFRLLEQVSKAYRDKRVSQEMPPPIRLQLIQALIDQGRLMEANDELEELAEECPPSTHEGGEARGLIGRVSKQVYVDAGRSKPGRLRKAVDAYIKMYRFAPEKHWWHGINVVACLDRAARDGIGTSGWLQPSEDRKQLAEEILATVAAIPQSSQDYTWAAATALEASIALADAAGARSWCEKYIESDYADAFELGSTERQLREVWQLSSREAPGADVLPIIQGRLALIGGQLTFGPTELRLQSNVIPQAQLGSQSGKALNWIENLVRRARSVAKITKTTDETVGGSGFIVRAEDLWPGYGAGHFLLTNHHVVNETGAGNALRPQQASVHLTRAIPGEPLPVKVLWSCADIDVSLCEVPLPDPLPDPSPERLGMPLGRSNDLKPTGTDSSPRLFVLGHPRVGALEVSLYDNFLIDFSPAEGRVRYRSPTEEGSSGSAVLSEDLEVVAVHHATLRDRKANQGVLIDNIRERARADRPT